MKVTVNQLEEQVNERNPDLTIQQLKKENNQLHQLVNKYRQSNNASRISVGSQTEQVSMSHIQAYKGRMGCRNEENIIQS